MRNETIETVCSFDPELDKGRLTKEELIDFCLNRSGLDSVRHAFTVSGPTIFTLREIPREVFLDFVKRGENDDIKRVRAFMCGVSLVKNIYQRSGSRIQEWCGSDSRTYDGRKYEMMKPEDLKLFSPLEIDEIGGVAYAHSDFPPRIVGCFRLQPTSLRMLEDGDYLRAGSIRTSPESSSAEQSDREEP